MWQLLFHQMKSLNLFIHSLKFLLIPTLLYCIYNSYKPLYIYGAHQLQISLSFGLLNDSRVHHGAVSSVRSWTVSGDALLLFSLFTL